jgi:hypothetical protein
MVLKKLKQASGSRVETGLSASAEVKAKKDNCFL